MLPLTFRSLLRVWLLFALLLSCVHPAFAQRWKVIVNRSGSVFALNPSITTEGYVPAEGAFFMAGRVSAVNYGIPTDFPAFSPLDGVGKIGAGISFSGTFSVVDAMGAPSLEIRPNSKLHFRIEWDHQGTNEPPPSVTNLNIKYEFDAVVDGQVTLRTPNKTYLGSLRKQMSEHARSMNASCSSALRSHRTDNRRN